MRSITLAALAAFLLLIATTAAGQGPQNCPMHKGKAGADAVKAGGHQHRGGTDADAPEKGPGMRGRGMGMRGDKASHHENIHSLMGDHAKITRKIEQVPGGVLTETTSKDAKVTETIRVHAREMKDRLESGTPIRMFDPLFREIFANHDKIEMKIEDIPGGVRVTETSKDADVALLIRKHAEAVDGFVAEGMAKMHEPTPLPDGYGKKK
ncbi:MAG: hypothetical protein WA208_04630 [Thermoanaerobaculia bacterium]